MGENRRRHARASVVMHTTLFRREDALGTFRVQNLSLGGALVEGTAPLEVGQPFELLLELSPSVLLRATATIVRQVQLPQPSFALAFSEVLDGRAAALEAAVAENLYAAQTASVLVACDDDLVGKDLARAIQSAGHGCIHVTRELEIIHCLEGKSCLRTAIVDSSFGTKGAGQTLAYLADARPQIRSLLMVDAATARVPQNRTRC